jgi:hypothetical protein
MKYRVVIDNPDKKSLEGEIIAKECDVKDEEQLIKIIKDFLEKYPTQQPRIRYEGM